MNSRISLPLAYSGYEPDRVLSSITAVDQYDDWVPDPLCYADVRRSPQAALTRVKDEIRSRSVDVTGSRRLEITSEGRAKFNASVVPLVARVVFADVVASIAGTAQREIHGDYVFGYKYQKKTEAYGRDWYADAFAAKYDKADSPCSNGDRDKEPGLPADWNDSMRAKAPPAVFTAGGDGLYECLDSVGDWLVGFPNRKRGARWCDMRQFYPSIRRNALLRTLRECGAPAPVAGFIEEFCAALAPPASSGLISMDDAVGFLANFSLKPVDDALTEAKIPWRRFGDEYFLLAYGEKTEQLLADRAQFLSRVAATQGFTLRADGGRSTTIDNKQPDNLERLADNCVASHSTLASDGFVLYVLAQASTLSDLETEPDDVTGVTGQGSWPRILRRVLEQPAGKSRLNSTFLLLRTMNFARRDDLLCTAPAKLTDRGKRYRDIVAAQKWLPEALLARTKEAAAGGLTWHLLWLIRLAGDLPELSTSLRQAIGRFAGDRDSWVRGEALVTLARLASRAQVEEALRAARYSGDWFPDRCIAVAAALADARFSMGLVDGPLKPADGQLVAFLKSEIRRVQ